MGTTNPQGMSVQALYRLYREDHLYVNRRYQRKLVWTIAEKQRLLQSIRKDYPIPLILLAERVGVSGSYEIIDGMQRLNAIFTFIENTFDVDGRYFDVDELSRARQLAEDGFIELASGPKLTKKECAQILEYQLAVTIYPTPSEEAVWDIFRRINSNGKHLSPQETRQAGVLGPFADVVRKIAADIRGDASTDALRLCDMPAVSIDSPRTRQGYGVHAEETSWCRQGVLLAGQLRDSEDEQLIADIVASVLLSRPLATSREVLDDLYNPTSSRFKEVESALLSRGHASLEYEIRAVFSVLREIIEKHSAAQYALRDTLRKKKAGNPIKGPFYALFMALYELLVVEELTPDDPSRIMQSLRGVDVKLNTERHHTTESDRRKNIDVIKGLVRSSFTKKQPPAFKSGPGMLYDLENALRRSSIETARYECKQGFLSLDTKRAVNKKLIESIPNIICAIANVGPESDGYIFLGVADKKEDAVRIRKRDGVQPHQIGRRWVVGVDREADVLGNNLEGYARKIADTIKSSSLSDPCKTQVLSQIDVISYRGLHVIRIRVPQQSVPTYIADEVYIRKHSSKSKANAREVAAIAKLFG